MERVYKKLYELSVKHDFYENGVSQDFSFLPIGKTATLLKAHGLFFKESALGFDVMYRTVDDEGNPAVPLTEPLLLTLGVRLPNEQAYYFTKLPEKTAATDLYFADIEYDSTTFELESVAVKQPSFSENYTFSFSRATLQVVDKYDQVRFSVDQDGLEDLENPGTYHFSFGVNLSPDMTPGKYTVKVLKEGVLQEEESIYVLNRFNHPQVIGVLELTLGSSMDYDEKILPYHSELSFTVKEALWEYRIELTRDFKEGEFSITNADEESDLFFTETSDLEGVYLKGSTVVFKASEVIPKYELPNKNFSLKVTAEDISMVLDELPNPPHDNANATIYIKI